MPSTIDSGLKIFDMIKILAKSPCSRSEICKLFGTKEAGIDKSTVSKYIRTLRKCGFEIIFNKGRFQICKTPFKIILTEEELKGFRSVLNLADFLFKGKTKNQYTLTKYKLENLIETSPVEKKENFKTEFFLTLNEKEAENIIKLNEYILIGPVKIKIKYNFAWHTIIPKEIKYRKNGIFLICKNEPNKKSKVFRTNVIKNIKFINFVEEREIAAFDKTVFKITGRLKKNYCPKEGEIVSYERNNMFVTNMMEDKEALFNRLLRYGKYCEVVFPEKDRKKFAQKIENLLKHYKSI